MKNQKGITLVALVITIIVLLILAGVSISLVLGQNGILSRATGAVATNEKATAEQEVKMAVAEAQVAYYGELYSNETASHSTLEEYLADTTYYGNSTSTTGNCKGATAVAVQNVTGDGVYVRYTATSGKDYCFKIDTTTKAVSEITHAAALSAVSSWNNLKS